MNTDELLELGFINDDTVKLEPSYLDDAIIGYTQEGNLVYSYDQLAECFVKYDGMTEEEAIQFVDYNTLRSLPYMLEMRPIVMFNLEDFK